MPKADNKPNVEPNRYTVTSNRRDKHSTFINRTVPSLQFQSKCTPFMGQRKESIVDINERIDAGREIQTREDLAEDSIVDKPNHRRPLQQARNRPVKLSEFTNPSYDPMGENSAARKRIEKPIGGKSTRRISIDPASSTQMDQALFAVEEPDYYDEDEDILPEDTVYKDFCEQTTFGIRIVPAAYKSNINNRLIGSYDPGNTWETTEAVVTRGQWQGVIKENSKRSFENRTADTMEDPLTGRKMNETLS